MTNRKNNRKCVCCGKEYYFCPSCSSSAKEPSWKTIYCSNNCRKVFMTVTDFNYKEITKEQAVENLKKCDLNYPFKASIKLAVNALVNQDQKKEEKTKEKVGDQNNIPKQSVRKEEKKDEQNAKTNLTLNTKQKGKQDK